MRLNSKLFFAIGLLAPVIVVFRFLFMGSNVWGDAPYIAFEAMHELISEPYAWTQNGQLLGGVNSFIWIWPVMLLYGVLGSWFGAANGTILNLLFYVPAILVGIVGAYHLAIEAGYKRQAGFVAATFYVFNTYFLLLVDGGQVGVSLAYGFFPLALVLLKKFSKKQSRSNFVLAFAFTFLIVLFDPRFFVIMFSVFLVWLLLERDFSIRKLISLIALTLPVMGLHLYWVVPLVKISREGQSEIANLGLTSVLNGLFVYQPHWPENIFGVTTYPVFYFGLLPILIFGTLLYKARKKEYIFILVILVSIFLLGQDGSLLRTFKYGFAFRDTTKFFAPLILFSGILLGGFVEKINNGRFVALIYFYLLFLILPALTGNLNFVLSRRDHLPGLAVVEKNLLSEGREFRTAWFPERSPLALHSDKISAIDAKSLAELRPLARLNAGSFDKFNYMHSSDFAEWYSLFGIKYMVFSGNPRVVEPSVEEVEQWDDLLDRVATASGLVKEDWATDVPVYSIEQTVPRLRGSQRAYFVVGSDDVYDSLEDLELVDNLFLFFEDGKWDPRELEGIASGAGEVVFNKKDMSDLKMSFLQENFVNTDKALANEWAVRASGDYLRYKYEFLINDFVFSDFDYSRGVSFSTVANEKMVFKMRVDLDSDYVVAVRVLGSGDGVKIGFNGKNETYEVDEEFGWYTRGVRLGKGDYILEIENMGGFSAVNVVALLESKDWNSAQQLTENFVGHFGRVGTEEIGKSNGQFSDDLVYKKTSPVKYSLESQSGGWVVFNDSYHELWKVKRGRREIVSLPAYSAVNAFYVGEEPFEGEMVFEGQESVRWGLYFSGLSALLIAIIFLWTYPHLGRK